MVAPVQKEAVRVLKEAVLEQKEVAALAMAGRFLSLLVDLCLALVPLWVEHLQVL